MSMFSQQPLTDDFSERRLVEKEQWIDSIDRRAGQSTAESHHLRLAYCEIRRLQKKLTDAGIPLVIALLALNLGGCFSVFATLVPVVAESIRAGAQISRAVDSIEKEIDDQARFAAYRASIAEDMRRRDALVNETLEEGTEQ